MHSKRYGFTLLELAMVLVVSGLMLGFVLKTTQTVNTKECYADTQQRMATIKAAIERFTMKNDRFPLPAQRNVGVESPSYGREALVANLDSVTNADTTVAVFGAVPFQVLGIPVENAADCWGHKFTYVVTKDLTDATKFVVPTTNGAMTVKTNIGDVTPFLSDAGYILISHGEDALGAVKNNYYTSTNTLADRRWCTDDSTNKTQNCSLKTALINSVFNNGKDAGANYFDDLVVYRGKPWKLSTAAGNAYCWGENTYGRVGDASTTNRAYATAVSMPSGVTMFTAITSNAAHSCALSSAGIPYCWGSGSQGMLGNGLSTDSSVPVAVTLPGGVTSFKSISVGGYPHALSEITIASIAGATMPAHKQGLPPSQAPSPFLPKSLSPLASRDSRASPPACITPALSPIPAMPIARAIIPTAFSAMAPMVVLRSLTNSSPGLAG